MMTSEPSDIADGAPVAAHRSPREVPRAARLAGAVLVLVGAANTAFGVLALATDLVRLTPAVSGALVVLGAVTAALGMLVHRGTPRAATLALVVFGGLFVLQAVRASVGDDGAGAMPALLTLALVVVPLLFVRRGRR